MEFVNGLGMAQQLRLGGNHGFLEMLIQISYQSLQVKVRSQPWIPKNVNSNFLPVPANNCTQDTNLLVSNLMLTTLGGIICVVLCSKTMCLNGFM